MRERDKVRSRRCLVGCEGGSCWGHSLQFSCFNSISELLLQALSWRAEQQEEVRLLLQEKDQYREQVRQLTEQSDRLELLLLRSQGAELQLRARLRRFTFDGQQVRKGGRGEIGGGRERKFEPEEMMTVGVSPQCERSSGEEGEEPTEDPTKGQTVVTISPVT